MLMPFQVRFTLYMTYNKAQSCIGMIVPKTSNGFMKIVSTLTLIYRA